MLSAKIYPKRRDRHDPSLQPSCASTSSSTPPAKSSFTLRPGVYGDVPAFADAYYTSFADTRPGASDDNLLDVLFPEHAAHPVEVRDALERILAPRLWSLEYRMSALVDDATGAVVGLLCLKRPKSEIWFWERWVSPGTWLNSLYTTLYTLYVKLLRPRSIYDTPQAAAFATAMSELYPRILCSRRRRDAWYLSIVAVQPAYQGLGLGGAILDLALAHVASVGAPQPLTTPNDAGTIETEAQALALAQAAAEQRNAAKHNAEVAGVGPPAMWLTARKGTEGLYRKFGFVKIMESSTGGLAEWNGGAVMFRGLSDVTELP